MPAPENRCFAASESRVTPRQPAYIRLLNRLGAGLAAVGLEGPRVDAQRLLRFACWRTGLGDSGDPAALEGLHQLARSLDEEARLSQLGRFVAFFNLLNLLSVRLRLIDYRARHPQVAAQRIEKPLFITGLPRTGTTILHELIARDERCRSPATWEVTRPLPPAQRETYDVDSRIASVGRLVGMLERMAPGFQRIHAVGGALPQECVYLLSSSFHSEQFAYMFNVPSYRDWLLHDRTLGFRLDDENEVGATGNPKAVT
ncbi:MAG: sulfotransferase, partial [Halioglobus sp.]